MHQDNPCAAYHSGSHGGRHLKIHSIPLSIGILHTEYRLTSPRDSQEPLLEIFRMGGGITQHRLEHMRLMAADSMGGVQTIIMSFSIGTTARSPLGSCIPTLSFKVPSQCRLWLERLTITYEEAPHTASYRYIPGTPSNVSRQGLACVFWCADGWLQFASALQCVSSPRRGDGFEGGFVRLCHGCAPRINRARSRRSISNGVMHLMPRPMQASGILILRVDAEGISCVTTVCPAA